MYIRGAQNPGAKSPLGLNLFRWLLRLWVLSMDLVSCHPSVAYTFVVTPDFLKNMWIPDADLCIRLPFCFTLCERRYQDWHILFQWPVTITKFSPLYYKAVGRDSSVGIATRYGLHGPGIEYWQGRDFPHPSWRVPGPTQPPIK